MTTAPLPFRPRTGMRLPLICSVALHGLLAAALWSVPTSRQPVSGPDIGCVTVSLGPEARLPPEVQDPAEVVGTLLPTPTLTNPVRAEGPHVDTPLAQPSSIPGRRPAGEATGTIADPGTSAGSATGRSAGEPEFFGVPLTARKIAFVIDCSASMGENGGLPRAKAEVRRSLERLPAGSRFQVICYHRQAEALPLANGGWVDATDEHRRRAGELFDDVRAEGGTDHWAGFRLAFSLDPEMICLLTDGDDFTPRLMRHVTQINGGRAALHLVILQPPGRPLNISALERFAADNRGTCRTVAGTEPPVITRR